MLEAGISTGGDRYIRDARGVSSDAVDGHDLSGEGTSVEHGNLSSEVSPESSMSSLYSLGPKSHLVDP